VIKIIDNFFNEKDLKMIQDFALNKAYYTPSFTDENKEKTKENFYGNRYYLNNNIELLNLFKNQAEYKFKIKIIDLHQHSSIDQRNLDHFKPHIDTADGTSTNILIMLYGPTAVTNGTVFYTDSELDIHVGFRENRAVMFPSTKFHSQHASITPNLLRYTSTLFLCKYEEVLV